MKGQDGKIWFQAGIDDSQLKRGVTSINQSFNTLDSNATKTGNSISNMFKTAAVGAAAYLTAQQALGAATQVIDLTAQRELLESSYEVMFGGIAEARKKIAEVTEYAIISPYEFLGTAKVVQTLSAFGVEADKIMPSLRMLGDVAAGNAQRFESLGLVFAQTTSAGKLMGQDLLQYVSAGFNPLQEISRTTGVAVSELREQMSAGAISAEMVADAFTSATSEGGKFHNMTLKMSESIEAYRSTFQSAIIEKQIEWGKNNEDMIKGAYKFGVSLVNNLDSIAKAFGVLVVAVGSYKASLIALNVVQALNTKVLRMAIVQKRLAAMSSIILSNAEAIAAAKTILLASAQRGLAVSLKAVGLAIASNPIGLLITLVATATAAWFLFRKEVETTEDHINSLNKAIAGFKGGTENVARLSKRYEELKGKTNLAKKEQEELRTVIDALAAAVPKAAGEFDKYGKILDINMAKVKEFSKAQRDAAKITLEKTISDSATKLKVLQKEMDAQTEIYTKGTKDIVSSYAATAFAPSYETTYTKVFSKEEQQEAAAEFQKLDKEVAQLSGTISAAERALKGLNEIKIKPKVEDVEIISFKEQINATVIEIDRLKKNIVGLRTGGKLSILDAKGEEKKITDIFKAINEEEAKLSAAQEKLSKALGYDPTKIAKKPTTIVVELVADAGSIRDLQNQISDIDATLNLKLLTPEQRTKLEADKKEIEDKINAIKIKPDAVTPTIDVAKLLAEYETYTQERLRVDKEFKEKEDALVKDGADAGSLELLRKDWKATLASLDVEAAKTTGTLGKLFDDASQKNTKAILDIVAEAEKLLAILSMPAPEFTADIAKEFGITKEQFDALIPKVPELRERIDELNDSAVKTAGGFKDFGGAIDAMQEGLENGDPGAFTDGLSALNTKIQQASQLLSGFSDILANIGTLSGNETWNNVAEGIEQVNQVLSETASMAVTGNELGGTAGAIIGGAIGLVSSVTGLFVEAKQRHDEALKAIIQAEKDYTSTVLQLERQRALSGEGQTTIFGVDEYSKSLAALNVYATEMANLEEQKKKIAGIEIVTGHEKTGLFGWGKGKDVYSGILEVFPELLDAQGNFDTAVAKTILETQNLDEASRETLEGITATAEQAEAAYAGLKDYFSSIFGSIGNTIADTIADGFRSGKDVGMQVIADLTVGLEQFAKDMAYSLAFGDLMKQAEADLLSVQTDKGLTEEQKLAKMAEIMAAVANDSKDATDKMEQYLQMAKDSFEQAGIEGAFEPDKAIQEQAKAGATVTITETTGANIDGKMTALQLTSGQTADNTGRIANFSAVSTVVGAQTNLRVTEIRDSMDVLNLRVKGIHAHTKMIAEYTAVLPLMAKDIKLVVTNTNRL